MTRDKIKEILERAERATPGQWDAEYQGGSHSWIYASAEFGGLVLGDFCRGDQTDLPTDWNKLGPRFDHVANTEFCAHAREDVPELCKALLAAMDKIDKLKSETSSTIAVYDAPK